jgi:hypothetical protein
MKRTMFVAVILALISAGALAADQPTRWINVHVDEPSSSTHVQVHLPLDLVLAVIDGIEVESFDRGKIELECGDVSIDWPEVVSALKDAPDGEFVKVDSDEADVLLSKENGLMLVHVTEKDGDHAVVDVRVPMSMIDALRIDHENRVDVAAFLRSLDELPAGELARVSSDEANVRVWVE